MGWAEALSGLGAGLQGQGPQWQVAHNDRLKTLSELDDKRKQAMLEDFRSTLVRLKSGDTGGASQLLQDRLEAITQLGGDPTDTAEINRMIQEGRIDEAVAGLQELDDMAVANGKLPSMAPKYSGITDTAAGGKAGFNPMTGQYEDIPAAEGVQFAPTEASAKYTGITDLADGGKAGLNTLTGMYERIPMQEGMAFAPDSAAAAATADPSNVREYQYWASLSPTQQEQYLQVKRATQLIDMGGGLQGRVSNGQAVPVTSQPGQTPDDVRADYAGAEATLAGQKAQSEQLAKDAGAASTTAFETYQSVISAIPKYDMAIAALNKGANSGKIAGLFPTIQSATVELENVRNMMGLDLIAVSKFGALSEGERKTAMETAIPDLPPKELAVWLETKKRGQQKMAKLYADVAIYLGKPGNTLPMWLAEQQAKLDQQAGGASPGGGSEMPEVPAAIDNSRSGAVLLQDANGNRAYQYPDGRIEEIN